MQERDDALLQIQQQVEKDRDVASLEEQHAAVIASMRSELNAAESAAKAEQQHREELHIAAAKAEADQAMVQGREALRDQVAVLAIKGAEQILRKEVNASVHADLLSRLKTEL